MMEGMKTVILAISHVKKGDSFLFRKKPDGTLPYKETWYGFGTEVDSSRDDIDVELCNHIKKQTGINVTISEHLWWDMETKPDLDGNQTFYVYLHTIAEYFDGEPVLSEGIEKLVWIPVEKLDDYAIVPPSKKFLAKYFTLASHRYGSA